MERKYRWTLTGLNDKGETVFDESFGKTNFPGNDDSISFTPIFPREITAFAHPLFLSGMSTCVRTCPNVRIRSSAVS